MPAQKAFDTATADIRRSRGDDLDIYCRLQGYQECGHGRYRGDLGQCRLATGDGPPTDSPKRTPTRSNVRAEAVSRIRTFNAALFVRGLYDPAGGRRRRFLQTPDDSIRSYSSASSREFYARPLLDARDQGRVGSTCCSGRLQGNRARSSTAVGWPVRSGVPFATPQGAQGSPVKAASDRCPAARRVLIVTT